MSDFLSPTNICAYTSDRGIQKTLCAPGRQILLSILGGAYIAFAAEGSSMAAFNLLADPATYGLGRCVAGLVFPTGLMMVMLAGGELFLGNTLMGVALLERHISWRSMMINWIYTYLGNLVGALLVAHLMVQSGLFNSGSNLLGGVAIRIAASKTALPFLSAFYLGILCNWLVCLAVWMGYGAKSTTGKVLGIFFPIWLFITSGFENCVANMYYIPAGLMAKSNPAWAAASGLSPMALEAFTWQSFFVNNLLPVTLGNIVGGGIFVGMAYWAAYLKPARNAV